MQLKLLLVLTYREVELDEGRAFNDCLHTLNRERLTTRIKLGRLDLQQTEALLATLFAEPITPELLDGIYRETEGNPFFIEEVCKALIEDGQVYREGNRWSRLAIEEMEIPQSVRIAIQSRVGRLPEAVTEVLRMAAVLGREFEYGVLQALADQDEDELITALEQAGHAQLIQEVRHNPQRPATASPAFLFTHALIHVTLYESLSGLRRQRLHRQAAAALERLHPENQAALAHHYAQAGLPEAARPCCLKAGQQALSAFANQEAEKYYRLAVDLGGPEAERAQGLFGLGMALYQESRPAEAMAQWEQALPILRQLHDLDRLAETHAHLVSAARLRDDIEESIALAEAGLKALASAPASAGLAALVREAGTSYSFGGHSERAISLYRQALQIAEQGSSLEEQSQTMVRLGFELAYAPDGLTLKDGTQMLERAYALAEEGGYLKAAELAQTYLSEIERDFTGNLQAALEHATRALQLSRQIGMAASELFNIDLLCSIQAYFGNLAELEALVERGAYQRQLIETAGSETYAFRTAQAAVAFLQGDWERTETILQAAFDEACRNKNVTYAGFTAYYLSMFLIGEEQWQRAESVLQASLWIDQPLGVIDCSYRAIIYAHTNRLESAQQMLQQGREIAAGNPIAAARIALAQAEAEFAVVEQRWEMAWAIFDQLTYQLDRAGIRFFEAQMLRRWSAAHLRRGTNDDRQAARQLLERLAALYTAMGATKLAGQAQDQAQELL